MFTGLIEDLGTLRELRRGVDQARITVTTSLPPAELQLGESIAVNGVCLTVVTIADGTFSADVSPETLDCTTLGRLTPGAKLNLERALRLSDRLGGHLVTGHVDGLATVAERRRQGNAWLFRLQADSALIEQLVSKGSVTVDGISLTVNEVGAEDFSLAVIPHTLEMTTLKDRLVGAVVNIETDLIGKYVARFMQSGKEVGKGERAGGVTMESLARHGFL
jgi:riboflavin synthase